MDRQENACSSVTTARSPALLALSRAASRGAHLLVPIREIGQTAKLRNSWCFCPHPEFPGRGVAQQTGRGAPANPGRAGSPSQSRSEGAWRAALAPTRGGESPSTHRRPRCWCALRVFPAPTTRGRCGPLQRCCSGNRVCHILSVSIIMFGTRIHEQCARGALSPSLPPSLPPPPSLSLRWRRGLCKRSSVRCWRQLPVHAKCGI